MGLCYLTSQEVGKMHRKKQARRRHLSPGYIVHGAIFVFWCAPRCMHDNKKDGTTLRLLYPYAHNLTRRALNGSWLTRAHETMTCMMVRGFTQ